MSRGAETKRELETLNGIADLLIEAAGLAKKQPVRAVRDAVDHALVCVGHAIADRLPQAPDGNGDGFADGGSR